MLSVEPSHHSGPAAGTIIGGLYRIVGNLGHGGMGVVMVAHDEQLERNVAIKLIRRELINAELQAQFLSEARAMARVHHPNVLPIYAFGQYEGAPYFVTELVEGQTVDAWLRSRPPGTAPDLEVALRILDETCQGVSAIHAAATVHRDLKPSNLLLDKNMGVRVADLGVADLLRRIVDGERRENFIGTPAYMAPEMVLLSDVPPELLHRADVYSLGCIAFELLTGRQPFLDTGGNVFSQMFTHVTDEVPRPSSLRPELSQEFDEVVLRALAKDPAERTPTVEALRRGLLSASANTREPVRILVAEDDADFRGALEFQLRRDFPDADIDCVGDGAAALQAFDQRHHSVAILDLQLPKLDGIELTGLIRARAGAQAVPIIVVTASGGPAEWKRLSAMGADGFLVKPVNLQDVVTLVRRALGDRSRSNSVQPVAGMPNDTPSPHPRSPDAPTSR